VPRAASQPVSFVEVVIRRKRSVLYQLAIGSLAFVALVTSVKLSRPVFLGRAPVGEQLAAHAYVDPTSERSPWMDSPAEVSLKTPQFLLDRELFTMDLLRTGKVSQTRARGLADIAVREAYTRQIPPALVLGVMLTENDQVKRNARSKVGAMGLMQIMPRVWMPNLGPILGRNLKDDETNLRYGVYILMHFAKRTADTLDAANVTNVALLRYNGCVNGTNTRDCRAYPEKVRRHVNENARTICSGLDFHECVALPLWAALRDTTPPPAPAGTTR